MLKFLIILVCIFFLIRMVGKLFVVSTFNNLSRRMEDEMKRRQNFNQPGNPEGQVTIEHNSTNKKNSQGGGDYVDYEEVK